MASQTSENLHIMTNKKSIYHNHSTKTINSIKQIGYFWNFGLLVSWKFEFWIVFYMTVTAVWHSDLCSKGTSLMQKVPPCIEAGNEFHTCRVLRTPARENPSIINTSLQNMFHLIRDLSLIFKCNLYFTIISHLVHKFLFLSY